MFRLAGRPECTPPGSGGVRKLGRSPGCSKSSRPTTLLHGVLKRHPVALATLARHHLDACVDGARTGYRTARTELGPHLPPSAIEAVLTAYRNEGRRLAAAAQAADLVERALHGEVFVRQSTGGRSMRPSSARRAITDQAKSPGPQSPGTQAGAHRKPD